MKRFTFLFALIMVLGVSTQMHAALFNRGTDSAGNRLIYDSDRNITWYDCTHSTTDGDTWGNHLNWAAALTVNFGGTVYDDWRLPTITIMENPPVYSYDGSTTYGYNITTSEMGHLFYTELGNLGYFSRDGIAGQPGWGLINTGPFEHLQPTWYYTDTSDGPWTAAHFQFYTGEQYVAAKLALGGTGGLAMAVRNGDVPCVQPADLSGDCLVDMDDFTLFASWWLRDDCVTSNGCEGADFDTSGDVGFSDLQKFCTYWLQTP